MIEPYPMGRSTKIHLSISANPKRFIIFVVIVLVALAASSYLATWILLRGTYGDIQQDYVKGYEARLEGNIDSYLQTYLVALTDLARLPILVNAVENPSGRTAVIQGRQQQLLPVASAFDFWLLDLDGEVIAQASDAELSVVQKPWLTSLVDGHKAQVAEFFAHPESGELWLRCIVPILNDGLPAGLLIAEQKADVESFLSDFKHDEQKYLLEFSDGDKVLEAMGGGGRKASGISLSVPNLNNTITLFVDFESVDGDLYELLLVQVVISLILVALFLLIIWLGNRLFVIPSMQNLAAAQAATSKTNDRLEIANDELSQFAYRSSHDLRAPLSTVLGLTKFAISDLEAGDLLETKQNLNKIALHVEKLDRLVGTILELSRADLDDARHSSIDVISIVKKMEQSLVVDGVEKVQFRYDSELTKPFLSQETRITQILENLLSNAVKYRNTKVNQSYVAVHVSSDAFSIYLDVCDNGIGIPKERFDEVFSMFKRFHPTVALGSGLGMSIVKKHVDRLGGDIRFDSSCAGTNIRMVFPQNS